MDRENNENLVRIEPSNRKIIRSARLEVCRKLDKYVILRLYIVER